MIRECVEKLQLLSSPDERARKLQEIPEVIADPNVDPDYDSDDKEDMPKGSNQGMDSHQWDNSKGGWDGVQQISGNTWENRKSSTSSRGRSGWKRGNIITQNHGWSHDHLDNNEQNTNSANWNRGKEKSGDEQSSGWDSKKSCVRDDGSKIEKCSSEKNIAGSNWCGSYAGVGSLHSSSEWQQEKDQTHKSTLRVDLSTKPPIMEEVSETGKVWHYKDPTGTIQGPFSMLQLRKWNMKGFFPIDLRIWRTHEMQEGSILLTDAIAGNFQKKSNNLEANRHSDQTFAPNRAVMINENPGTGWTGNGASTWTGSEQNYISNMSNWKSDGGLVSSTNDGKFMKNSNHESVGWCSSIDIQHGQSTNDGWAMPQSSGHTMATVEAPISAKEGLNCVITSSELTDSMTVQSLKSSNAGWNAGSSEVWGASKNSEGTLSASLTVENHKFSGGWGGDSNEGIGVLKSSTNLRSSLSAIEASSSGRSSWVGSNPSMLRGGNDGMPVSHFSDALLTNRALGGSQISEASMLRNAGRDGGPTKGWGINQCTDSSWKTPSVATVEISKYSNEGWCGPKNCENMLSSSSPAEPPKTTMDGWGAHQSSESLSRTVSVVETIKSINEGWGAPPSSENQWPKASEVDASKFTNEGWGAPQSSEKLWTALTTSEALEPITEVGSSGPNGNWVGSTPSEGWNESGRTENMEKVTRSESRNSQKSYHDPDSAGKFCSRPAHEGFRSSRNSKKDIPCKFHGRGFCKRGANCEFHHG
ncbi:hypothetical protein SUGI_0927280 [Cryptomeria japonica]|nr:hypothetical protein SUGI_0927280 [Cryptomeria japonica]